MGYTPAPPNLTLSNQSFVPTAQLATGAPANTRRSILVFGDGSTGAPGTGYEDVNCRMGLTLPVTPTRCRFRIRNANIFANTTIAQSITNTGIWWGTPTQTLNAWDGSFTGAPTQVVASSTSDFGTTELVTPWFTPPATAVANAFQGVSFGFTCASDGKMNVDSVPGWTWHSATPVGCAAAAGNAAVPGVGTAAPYSLPFDIRMEFEFVGQNQIGLYLGSSIENGFLQTVGTAVAYGHMGPDNTWPSIAANRQGHLAVNGGVGGGIVNTFLSLSTLSWTRFNDPTLGTLFGGTFPDYVVIGGPINESSTPQTLATYQGNFQSLITLLKGAGFTKIIACTSVPGNTTSYFGNIPTFNNGILHTGLSPGAGQTSIVVGINPNSGTTLTNGLIGPGGGNPGIQGDWFNGSAAFNQCWLELPASGIMEGPFTVTGVGGTSTLNLTISSSTLANAHVVGSPVLSSREGYRQQYNHWLRQGPLGVMAVIDMAKIGENGNIPPIGRNWYYYGNVDDIHPTFPNLYYAMGNEMAVTLAGI